MSTTTAPTGLLGRRLRLRRPSLIAAAAGGILVFWIGAALLVPALLPHSPVDFISDDSFEAPSARTWLGTDYLGRDLLARLISAARSTLLISFLATLGAHLIGDTLGILAALRGGWLAAVLERGAEVMLSLPKLIVGLVVIALVGPSATVLVLVTAGVYAATVFRIARAIALDLVTLDYIRAARLRGESMAWVMFGELLPNMLPLLAADFALRMSFSILFMSNLSFLGLGVQPPMADWGGLVRENLEGLASGSLASVYPTIAIASVTISLNLLVDRWGSRGGAGEMRT
ncbi:ABC transporter permease [Roseomonas sp. E05]|uniref:ABC transporter permease n=1 Tax=Roseomonas sp. E05 TaxID=3046310 RepID=UPI0024B9D86A|nr:ABC transporter permease [Roseomonas sp. E05]MDJ0391577.1 ABC transporter permease [Roseomonas sp. E05]